MWFRAELNSDGSIKKCVGVDARKQDDRYVCYIEAADRDEACFKAKRWFEVNVQIVKRPASVPKTVTVEAKARPITPKVKLLSDPNPRPVAKSPNDRELIRRTYNFAAREFLVALDNNSPEACRKFLMRRIEETADPVEQTYAAAAE